MPAIAKTKQDFQDTPSHDAPMDDMLSQVVELADKVRHEKETATRHHTLPDFTRTLRLSGRFYLFNDILAILFAFVVGGLLTATYRYITIREPFVAIFDTYTHRQFLVSLFLGAIAILWLANKGHYHQRLPFWESVGHILTISLAGFIVGGFIEFAAKEHFSRLWTGLSWALFPVFLFCGRMEMRRILRRRGAWDIRAIVVGKGPTAQAIVNALSREPEMGFTVATQIAASHLVDLERPHMWKYLLATCKASHVFLALEGSDLEKNKISLQSMTRSRVPCSIIPPWIGLPSSSLSPHHFMMQDVLMLHDTNRLKQPIIRFVKRAFDLVLASLALVVLSPLLLAVAIGVRWGGGPAMFTQNRVGKNGQHFACYKFRSMRSDAEQVLAQYLAHNPEAAEEWKKFQKLKDDVRITRFGHFIRKTSIDELPQLLNVVKGDMSLVGPRPIMPEQGEYYAEDMTYYEAVRPGITGPWQVSGRNNLTFKERVNLEAWYARNWSLWLDIVILLKTIPTLLSKGQAF